MIVTSWRIVKRKHAKKAFNGEGARKFGGRWNNPGVPLIYTAESQALAALEILVHIEAPEVLETYVLFAVGMDKSMIVDVDDSSLLRNWKANPAPSATRAIGDEWAHARVSLILRVPSGVVPSEHNYLINPRHRDFPRLDVKRLVKFRFDFRLLKRGYPSERVVL